MFRVLHIVPTAGIGGVSTNLLRLIDSFAKDEYHHDVCILGSEGFLSNELALRGLEFLALGIRNDLDALRAFRLVMFLRQKKYDLVHVHYRSFLGNLLLTIFCRAKKIMEHNSSDIVSNSTWKISFFYYLFGFHFNKVIAISQHVGDALLKGRFIRKDKLVVIRYGIVYEEFTDSLKKRDELRSKIDLPYNKKVVGILARIVQAKGIDIFIQVAAAIKRQDDNFIFVIAGDGPLLNKYRDLVKTLPVEPDIRFLGAQNDSRDILPALDIFLFLSRWEAFGAVLLEAMAVGIPIAAFGIPVVKEIFEDGKDALLVEPFDVNVMARSVLRIAYNHNLADNLSHNAKIKVRDEFSMNTRVEKIQGIYSEILKSSPRAR